MKNKFMIFCFATIQTAFAQFGNQIPQAKKYDAKKVIDATYGIVMYENLNFQTGGDSVRYDKKGYNAQDWIEDYYETGQLLHKGYYEDGKLKLYKNFYPSGNTERNFTIADLKHCSMKIYYDDGKLKSDILYYEGSPQIWSDYYQNGQLEYMEESTKSMEYLIQRKTFAEDGKPQDIFELVDKKKRMYSKKEYYENGKIKAEGPMFFNEGLFDYQKEGKWTNYDEKGNATSDKWVKGEEVK